MVVAVVGSYALEMLPVCYILYTCVFTGVLLILVRFHQRVSRLYNFWRRRGIPGPRPKFPFGTEFGVTLGKSTLEMMQWLYRYHGGKKFCGYIDLHQAKLVTGDPLLIKEIMIKSFDHFHDRPRMGNSTSTKRMLIELRGQEWKSVRSLISQTFTGHQLNLMHNIMVTNGERLRNFVREMCGKEEFDVMEPFGLFMLENTASCLLGTDCNVFEHPNSEMVRSANNVFSSKLKNIIWVFLQRVVPQAALKILLPPNDQAVFRHLVQEVIQQRRERGIVRTDVIQRMLDVKDKCGENVFGDEMIIQQGILFMLAGYRTPQTLLAFSAYCLATSPHCQDLVLEELDAAVGRHHGQLTSDALAEMVYLDRFISEVVRLYPPVIEMNRLVTKDFQIPGSGQTVPRGTVTKIPIIQLHRDPQYFPDPLAFDPDRFLPGRRSQIDQFTYIPFGGGPRGCIGKRFSLRVIKVALAVMLLEFVFEPGPSTPSPPAPVDALLLSVLYPSGGKIMLKIARRRQ